MPLCFGRFLSYAAVLGAFLSCAPAYAQSQRTAQTGLPRIEIGAGMHRIQAQLASTFEQRRLGLMHRLQMPANEGMFFVFDAPAVQCFWMKNTPLALTAAFVADDGQIVNLADMQPYSEEPHCSTSPVRYVLEMHRGWFEQKGIKAGMKLQHEGFVQ